MFKPYTDDDFEEKYQGQLDDTSDPQYAYEYGMLLYEISKRHYIENADFAEMILYWLNRYIEQENTQPECVKKSRYTITRLLSEYPELKEELAK